MRNMRSIPFSRSRGERAPACSVVLPRIDGLPNVTAHRVAAVLVTVGAGSEATGVVLWSAYRNLAIDASRWIEPLRDVFTVLDAHTGHPLNMKQPQAAAATPRAQQSTPLWARPAPKSTTLSPGDTGWWLAMADSDTGHRQRGWSQPCRSACGFTNGKVNTERIVVLVSSMTRRSTPRPIPPVGGMPVSSA